MPGEKKVELQPIAVLDIETRLAKKERSIILELVGTYGNIKGGTTCSWIGVSSNFSTVYRWLNDVCHARLKNAPANKVDQIFTSVPRSQPLDLLYIQWLIDNPFRVYADRIHLEYIEHDGKTDYYLRLTELDTWPSNVVYNFCIATRTSVEFTHLIKIWGELLSAGVNMGLAFIIATKCNYLGLHYEGDPWEWHLPGLHNHAGHFWFDPTSDWKRIIYGEMLESALLANYKARPVDGTPANTIWGQGDRLILPTLVEKTTQQLSDLLGLEKVEYSSEILEAAKAYVPRSMFDDDDEDDDDFDDDNEVFDEDEDDDI